MSKRILFLGANAVQAYAIKSAKALGYYVITCDYLPDNPGHQYSDLYLNISTVDKEKILQAAREHRIDGIISFASDVSAPTAAFVAEQLGLPGHPPAAIETLTHKDQFRAFLLANGFASPHACGYTDAAEAIRDWDQFRHPVVIKPTDSSGSKGVIKVTDIAQVPQAAEYALSFSRSRRFVMEEFVTMQGAQIIGDGFSVDGKLVFSLYGDHIFDKRSGGEFAVQGGMFPLSAGLPLKERIDAEVQRALTLLKMGSGAYNIEARLGLDGNVYLMEIGPRSGGNLIPELLAHATGVEVTKYTVLAAVGEPCTGLSQTPPKGFWSYYVIHTQKAGIYGGLQIDPAFRKEHVRELLEQVKPGDKITAFENASAALGVAICHFATRREMETYMRDISQHMVVNVLDM